MPVDSQQIANAIEAINDQTGIIVAARDDLNALSRMSASINNSTIEDAMFIAAKTRIVAACQSMLDTLGAT